MGSFITPPRDLPGPTTEFGWDVRNTVEAEPWTRTLSDVRGDIDRVAATGATWVRLGSNPWRLGWWSGTAYLWDDTHIALLVAQVRYAHSRGLKISFTWILDESLGLTDAQYLARAQAATTKIASAIGPFVSLLQIYNEVNASDLRTYAPISDADAPAYHRRVRDFVATIAQAWKAQAPGTLTTMNTYGYPPDRWHAQWLAFYDVIAPVVDVIGLDVYPAGWDVAIADVPRLVESVRRRYGKPVAVLETGFNATTSSTEQALSTYMPMLAGAWSRCRLLCVIWYTIRDTGPRTSTDGELRFGIHYQDGADKPYRAATLARLPRTPYEQGHVHGDVVPLVAGASSDAAGVSWRVISGGGRILGQGPAVTYLPPAATTPGEAVLGVRVDGGPERQVRVALAAHPWWDATPAGWVPSLHGRTLPA